MKTIKTILMLILFGMSFLVYSQVSISNDGLAPDASSMLDVKSITKGQLPPCMTESQMNAISSPAPGLMVYCTDCNNGVGCLSVYMSTIWQCGGGGCPTPVAPVATAGSGATPTQITANWQASSGATSYRLDVSTANDFSSFATGYNNLNVGNVITYNVTGLSNSTN